jgi:hypothetical protein
MGHPNKSKKNSNKKSNGSKKSDRKKVKYVWVYSKKAIYLVTGEPRESKYSYGVPIIPLHGYYKSGKKLYTAKELTDYYVILNLPKDADIDGLKDKRIVIMGYDKDEIYIDENETDKNESKGKGKKKGKDEDESEDRDEDEDEGKDNERDEDESEDRDEDERSEDDDEEGEEE